MNINKYFRLFFSLILVAFIITKIDVHKLTTLILSLKLSYVLLIILLVIVERFISIYRWNILLHAQGVRPSFFKTARFFLVSEFTGFFLPTGIGFDVMRSFSLGRYSSNHTKVASSTVVDRFLSTGVLIILTLCSIFLSYKLISNTNITVSVIMFSAIFIIITMALSNRSFSKKISRILFTFKKISKIKQSLKGLYDSLHQYKKNKSVISIAILLSFLVQILRIFMLYLLGLSLNINLGIHTYFLLVPLILFVSSMPISVNGIGIREGAFVYFFSKVGISINASFAVSLLYFGISIFTALIGGLIYAFSGLPQKRIENLASLPVAK